MIIVNRDDRLKCEVINVYGLVQFEKKHSFLAELHLKVSNLEWPFMVGRDFNLIMFAWEKSSDHVDQEWMDAFNSFIADNGIKELIRKCGKFT